MADTTPKRKRPRSSSVTADKEKVAQRVVDFFTKDVADRSFDIEARVQRYAKFRMWTEQKNWPWEDCCFSTDTELLTKRGWVRIADV